MITRVRELTRTITELYEQLAGLVKQVAPQLLAEKGLGVLIAAKLIGEIAGIDRFTSDAQLARISGCAPIPVSSGRTDRHRLDPGGNRQLNHAFHMLALTKIMPRPADRGLPRQTTPQRQDQPGSDPQPQTPPRPPRLPPPPRPQQRPDHHLLDIGAIGDLRDRRRAAHSGGRLAPVVAGLSAGSSGFSCRMVASRGSFAARTVIAESASWRAGHLYGHRKLCDSSMPHLTRHTRGEYSTPPPASHGSWPSMRPCVYRPNCSFRG